MVAPALDESLSCGQLTRAEQLDRLVQRGLVSRPAVLPVAASRLRLQRDWPWLTELAAAFNKLKALQPLVAKG